MLLFQNDYVPISFNIWLLCILDLKIKSRDLAIFSTGFMSQENLTNAFQVLGLNLHNI